MIDEHIGKYRILGSLGAGSMGKVYRAEDPSTGRNVAIKVIQSTILHDPSRRERFLQGLLAVMEVKHPGICPILEIGDEGDDFFVVTPVLEGKTLADRLRQGPIPWHEALDLAVKIGEVVAAGHEGGVLHRGLKPSNIWLQTDGSLVVMDFNTARFTELENGGRTAVSKQKVEFADTLIPMATLASMSPEQVRGGSLDHRSDIFSFGCTLYEMLTGHHPFESRSSLSRMHSILEGTPLPPSACNPELPRQLDAVLQQALAKSPHERWQSMRDFLDKIREIRATGAASHEDSILHEERAPQEAHSTAGRTIWWALVGLVVLLISYFLWLRS